MTYMNQLYIEQNDVVQRYLHGKLSADELIEFEKYMLLNPDIIEDIELSKAFKLGLELWAKESKVTPKVPVSNRWTWLWPAGGLVTGAFATWLLLGPINMPVTPDSLIVSPDIVYIDTVRGAIDDSGSQAEVLLDKHSNKQLLIFDVSGFAATQYTLTLADQSGAAIQKWTNITPNEKSELILQTSIQGLEPQHYSLILSDKDQNQVLIRTRLMVE